MTESGIGGRIKQIIQEQHLKQNAFAERLGISANYVHLITSGRKTSISEPLAKLIESTYGYSAKWVLTGEGKRFCSDDRQDASSDENLKNLAIQKLQRMSYKELRAVMFFIQSVEALNEDEHSEIL